MSTETNALMENQKQKFLWIEENTKADKAIFLIERCIPHLVVSSLLYLYQKL